MASVETKNLTETVGVEVLDVDLDRVRNDRDLPGLVMGALEESGILLFRGLGY